MSLSSFVTAGVDEHELVRQRARSWTCTSARGRLAICARPGDEPNSGCVRSDSEHDPRGACSDESGGAQRASDPQHTSTALTAPVYDIDGASICVA